ncbi:DUF3800 domain-containing protein [Aliarcobacter butzleri]|uniref:DUF3800 domain-containing protein n=1 Tax=Aliarcobacter butzleri TaxID=28197 RepID=UPI003B226373
MHFYMIDESGNLGVKDRHFVLGMFNSLEREKIKRKIKKFQNKHTKNEEIKGAKLNLSQKQELINSMKDVNYNIHYMVADKNNAIIFKKNLEKNLIYNYLLSFIVVKVIRKNTSLAKLVFHLDNHTIKIGSLNSFEEHIKIKAIENSYFGEIEVKYFDSHKHNLIQYADVISNVVYGKYEKGRDHLYNLFKDKIKTSFKFPLKEFGK